MSFIFLKNIQGLSQILAAALNNVKILSGGKMANIIVAAVLLIIVGLAIRYIIKEKKKGAVCIGCPHAGCCSKKGECSDN